MARRLLFSGIMAPIVRGWLVFLGLLGGVSACGSEDEFTVSVAGSYTVALANGANGCGFEMWNEGDTTTGVGLTINQEGKSVTALVDGASTLALLLFIGSAQFEGSVTGTDFDLVAYGTSQKRQGNCSYTLNARIRGTLSGDSVSGTLAYSPATNDNPDCAAVECSSVADFSGSRPPR